MKLSKVKTRKFRQNKKITKKNRIVSLNKKYKKHNSKKNKKGGYPSCNDPNYSIFNTNMLSLFPYKPSV
jgi:hypothetical protein